MAAALPLPHGRGQLILNLGRRAFEGDGDSLGPDGTPVVCPARPKPLLRPEIGNRRTPATSGRVALA